MKITHKIKTPVSKDLVDDSLYKRNISFFLLSKRGHYLSLGVDPTIPITNFNGWLNFIELKDHSKPYTLYKSIDNIYLSNSSGRTLKTDEVINNFSNIERKSENSKEKFVLVKNGLIYEASTTSGSSKNGDYINIDLDFREIFDIDDKGRTYSVYKEKLSSHGVNMGNRQNSNSRNNPNKTSSHQDTFFAGDDIIVIEYKKYFDNNLNELDKKYYLIIKGIDESYEVVNRWERRDYPYDSSRNSNSEYYIFKALKVLCDNNINLIFTFSEKKDKAISKLVDIMLNIEQIDKVYNSYEDNMLQKKFKVSSLSNPILASAYVNSVHALDGLSVSLQVNNKKLSGLWAGLPWFFQFWARDELVSLGGVILEDNLDFCKETLFKHLNEINADGRLPNLYPGATIGSSDGVGWLFKRISDFIAYCEEKDVFNQYFTLYDIKYVRERLRFSLKQIIKNYSRDGLIINNNLETWMDTFYKDNSFESDFREGFRIEIQALFLNMLRLINKLNGMLANKFVKKSSKLVNVTADEDYTALERKTVEKVRNCFLARKSVNGKDRLVLNDGYNCSFADVSRPNIFLAYYVYKDLLYDSEWEMVFDFAIEKLWCDWTTAECISGGLSTIDKENGLYQPNYTGQNNKSYHRGDSWFWINNIAAISLSRLNSTKYDRYIHSILNSSSEDILFSGYLGYASELSSSANFKSAGCFAQAWSIATYIELFHELYLK